MDTEIAQLEREAEAARAKLAADLAVLRSPATYSEFGDGLKREAMGAKDAVVESVRANVKSTAEGWIDEIKAKAAANPGAALLIGAGVAWRLFKHPPVATALVGAGILSLLRTSPEPSVHSLSDEEYIELAKRRLKEQVGDLALGVKTTATDLADTAKAGVVEAAENVRERVSELTNNARSQVQDIREAGKAQAGEWQDFAKSKTQEWRDAAMAATDELKTEISDQLIERTSSVADRVMTTANNGRKSAGNTYATVERAAQRVVSEENRDKLLLGAAGVAVTAALTLALQRRMSGSTER